MLRRENLYIQDFITTSEIPPDQLGSARMVLNTSARPIDGHSRVYNTNLIEVAVLMNENHGPRDIILNQRGGGLQKISDTHRFFDALQFVLLHPLAHDGWYLNLFHVSPGEQTREGSPVYTTKRLTARQFYSYHLHTQPGKSDAIFRTCRLFQEYLVVSFAKIENNRLYFIQTNQSKLRAELYNNLCDAMHRHDAQNSTDPLVVGRPVILPSSFAGSPRDMHRRFQDQMAIVRRLGKPDLFVTFTCNPNWPEITEALLPGQQAKDRPDIVSRVFKIKLKSLMADLVKDDIFGKCVAHVYVIEFQ